MFNGKKILFLLPSLEMGGSERQALILAEYLAAEVGARIEIWGVSGHGLLVKECERLGIPWRVLDFHWPARSLERLRALVVLTRLLRTARPDIILPYTLLPSVACGCVWRFTGAQGCLWNQRDTLGYRMGPFWERWAVRNSSGFIVNSRHVGDYLQLTFAVSPARVQWVPNAVRTHASRSDRVAWRRKLACGDVDLMVVMVANLHQQKAHAEVLSAWRIFLDGLGGSQGKPVLVLAGLHGKTYTDLVAQGDCLGISDSVRFPGQVDDIAGLLASADIGLFCSRSEGSPNGVLECMASGLPVVGTDIPGVREALGEGGSYFLSAPGDVAALANSLLMLARSAELRSSLGESNRQRVHTRYNLEAMGRRMVEIMELCCRQ
jgi:glycosyltransferase involved in cell wall biosynthesis